MSSAWSRLWETSLQSAADRGQHGAAQTPSARGHPPGAPFAQVSAAAHLGNPRQEELALALCPCPPLPLLPSRVGCIVGGRLHPSTRGSEHRRQPKGLQGWAPRCCWGGGVGGVLRHSGAQTRPRERDPGGGPRSTATVTACVNPPGSGLDSHKPRHSRSIEPCQRTNPSTSTGEESGSQSRNYEQKENLKSQKIQLHKSTQHPHNISENKLPAGKSTSNEDHGLLFSHSVVSDCDPMDCGTPGLPVHHHLLELSQTHVPSVGDAIKAHNTLSICAVNKP